MFLEGDEGGKMPPFLDRAGMGVSNGAATGCVAARLIQGFKHPASPRASGH
jgi:hypothetical protein